MQNLITSINATNELKAKFELHFDKSDGCWVWNRNNKCAYYGVFLLEGVHVHAHRVSWMIYCSDIPKGMVICHKCDNRRCINPSHLFVGTQRDNLLDAKSKGRLRNHWTQPRLRIPEGVVIPKHQLVLLNNGKNRSIIKEQTKLLKERKVNNGA